MFQKNCGSCKMFKKLKHFGICEAKDLRVTAQTMLICDLFKRIKYNRKQFKVSKKAFDYD